MLAPGITPIFRSFLPVSYTFIFMWPQRHCVVITIVMFCCCIALSRVGMSVSGVCPSPVPAMTIPL